MEEEEFSLDLAMNSSSGLLCILFYECVSFGQLNLQSADCELD